MCWLLLVVVCCVSMVVRCLLLFTAVCICLLLVVERGLRLFGVRCGLLRVGWSLLLAACYN